MGGAALRKGIRESSIMTEIHSLVDLYVYQLNHPSRLRRILSFVILLSIIFFSILVSLKIADPYPLRRWINLRLSIEDLGLVGVFIYLVMVSILPLFSPLSILIVTGSVVYGAFYGMILSYLGLFINANITYIMVKALLVDRAWGNSGWLAEFKDKIKRHGYPIVLLLQLITILPFVMVNAAAAGSGVSWKDFSKATCIGVLPTVFIFNFLGNSLVYKTVSPEMYVSCISVLAACLILLAVKKRDTGNDNRPPEVNT